MKWILNFLRAKNTIIMLMIAAVASFVTVDNGWELHHNTILFGLIISFPLVFSLQAPFKRREKALEYFSMLKSGLTATHTSFELDKKIPDITKTQLHELLTGLSGDITAYLAEGKGTSRSVYEQFHQVSKFITDHKAELTTRTKVRVVRYMSDVYNGVAYLSSLKTHRTSTGVRYMSYFFVALFPFIQAPVLNFEMHDVPDHYIFIATLATSLALSALVRIQRQLEDPFDQSGLDEIKLEEFRF